MYPCSKSFVCQSTSILTHLFPMHPFSTPWKHQKALRFFDFTRFFDVTRGWRKGAFGTNELKFLSIFTLKFSKIKIKLLTRKVNMIQIKTLLHASNLPYQCRNIKETVDNWVFLAKDSLCVGSKCCFCLVMECKNRPPEHTT